jgi:hypothetical protein
VGEQLLTVAADRSAALWTLLPNRSPQRVAVVRGLPDIAKSREGSQGVILYNTGGQSVDSGRGDQQQLLIAGAGHKISTSHINSLFSRAGVDHTGQVAKELESRARVGTRLHILHS